MSPRLAVLVALVWMSAVQAKVFGPCELAKTLRQLGAPEDQLARWVCIAFYESGYNTAAINRHNANGSSDHGIFQINDRYWCKNGVAGNDCNIDCKNLRTDNIAAAFKCARLIQARQGWRAWAVYNSGKCSGTRAALEAKFLQGC